MGGRPSLRGSCKFRVTLRGLPPSPTAVQALALHTCLLLPCSRRGIKQQVQLWRGSEMPKDGVVRVQRGSTTHELCGPKLDASRQRCPFLV